MGAEEPRPEAVEPEIDDARRRIWAREVELMAGAAAALPPLPPAGEAATARGEVERLRADGLALLGGALEPALCDALREDVDFRLREAQDRVRLGGAKNRFDIKLELAGPALAAARAVLRNGLFDVLAGVATPDAFLCEFGCLVSLPGAERQPVHPDLVWQERPLFTTFVPLQDVHLAMGPTAIIPGTHTPEAHAELCGIDAASHQELLRTRPNHHFECRKGDALVFDSRTLHAGGLNDPEAGSRRAQFYISVQQAPEGEKWLPLRPKRRTDPSAYSIIDHYHNEYRLKDFETWEHRFQW